MEPVNQSAISVMESVLKLVDQYHVEISVNLTNSTKHVKPMEPLSVAPSMKVDPAMEFVLKELNYVERIDVSLLI